MTFKQNLADLYFILPYISSINNKVSLSLSLLIGSSTFKVKIHNQVIKFDKSRFATFYYLLNCLTYALSYSLDSTKILKISFDENYKFEIPLQTLSLENSNLIELLYYGNKYGANFITNDIFKNSIREQTFKISSSNNRKIITTSNGINFFLDSISLILD